MPVAHLLEWRMTTRDWQEVCSNWGFRDGAYSVGKWGHAQDQDRLYNHAAFVGSLYHWLLTPGDSRWECDDYGVGVSSGDFWKVFVR